MDWDLKLGRMMEEGEAAAPVGRRRSRASSSSSGGLQQQVTCLVDGCTWDLNTCREYHRRHRVCERHSKTPVVLVAGEEQRFCQQCSRFQSLGEFDDTKRSCRKRLDGHNRRRRKTQPESSVYSNTLPGPLPAPMLMRAAPMYPPSSAWEMVAPPPFYTSSAADFGHIDCALSLLSTSGTQQQERSFPGGSTSSSIAFDVDHDHNHNPDAPPCRMFPFTWH